MAIGPQLEAKHGEAPMGGPGLVWRTPEKLDGLGLAELGPAEVLKFCTSGLEVDALGDEETPSSPVDGELSLKLLVVGHASWRFSYCSDVLE